LVPTALRTAALCRSKAATFTPDTWVWDTLDWVVFPWNEPAQTSEDLIVPASPLARPTFGATAVETPDHRDNRDHR
ncbi:MAG: hypothetical protein ACRDXB_20645, partial [Actinomycetes bacterium]